MAANPQPSVYNQDVTSTNYYQALGWIWHNGRWQEPRTDVNDPVVTHTYGNRIPLMSNAAGGSNHIYVDGQQILRTPTIEWGNIYDPVSGQNVIVPGGSIGAAFDAIVDSRDEVQPMSSMKLLALAGIGYFIFTA